MRTYIPTECTRNSDDSSGAGGSSVVPIYIRASLKLQCCATVNIRRASAKRPLSYKAQEFVINMLHRVRANTTCAAVINVRR